MDIDWGDYPYVTSSHCTVAGALLNGIPPRAVRRVWGVGKVYDTYVGKKNFEPDILYVDYLNICTSTRLKYGANVNSYTYIKSIAEELRGLAVERNIPIVSATQTTRSGFTNSDPGLEDTSESFALPATVDFMVALISSEEMEQLGQIMVKQLKNRYNDPTVHKRFVVGVDRTKMRLFDAEQSAQKDIVDDTPVMSNSKFGERYDEEENMKWMTKRAGRKNLEKLFAS